MHNLASKNAYNEDLLCEIWEEIGRLEVWGCIFERPLSAPDRLLRTLGHTLTELET